MQSPSQKYTYTLCFCLLNSAAEKIKQKTQIKQATVTVITVIMMMTGVTGTAAEKNCN